MTIMRHGSDVSEGCPHALPSAMQAVIITASNLVPGQSLMADHVPNGSVLSARPA